MENKMELRILFKESSLSNHIDEAQMVWTCLHDPPDTHHIFRIMSNETRSRDSAERASRMPRLLNWEQSRLKSDTEPRQELLESVEPEEERESLGVFCHWEQSPFKKTHQ